MDPGRFIIGIGRFIGSCHVASCVLLGHSVMSRRFMRSGDSCMSSKRGTLLSRAAPNAQRLLSYALAGGFLLAPHTAVIYAGDVHISAARGPVGRVTVGCMKRTSVPEHLPRNLLGGCPRPPAPSSRPSLVPPVIAVLPHKPIAVSRQIKSLPPPAGSNHPGGAHGAL